MTFWPWIIGLIVGYGLSIFTWPKAKELMHGAQVEAEALRDRARKLEAKILGK